MKASLLFLSLPIAAALSFAPRHIVQQDPQSPPAAQQPAELVAVMPLSELRYVDLQGGKKIISARNVVEIRMFDGITERIRLELLYENGDYALIDAQAMELLRTGGSTRDVRMVRSSQAQMRFPRLP